MFLTTLYSWCRYPMTGQAFLWLDDDDEDDDDVDDESRGRIIEDEENDDDGRRSTDRLEDNSTQWYNPFRRNQGRGSTNNHNNNNRPSRTKRIETFLHEVQWTAATTEGGDDVQREKDCCPICLVEFDSNDKVVSGHVRCCRNHFHKDCLVEWLTIRPNCPCCRTNLLVRRSTKVSQTTTIPTTSLLPSSDGDDINSISTTTPTTTTTSSSTPNNRLVNHIPTDDDAYDNDYDDDDRDTISSTGVDSISTTSDWTPEVIPDFAVDSWDHFWFLIF